MILARRSISPRSAGALLSVASATLLLLGPAARASDLMGAESCRACHSEAYRIWSESPHARATQALDERQRRSQLCLYCHSRDEIRSGQALVSDVSCETCHGGGRFYQAEVVMRDHELSHLFGLADLSGANAAPLCLSCHGGEQSQLKPFDVQAAMGRIDHWSADRAARKGKQSQRSPHGAAAAHTEATTPVNPAGQSLGQDAQGAKPAAAKTQLGRWLVATAGAP